MCQIFIHLPKFLGFFFIDEVIANVELLTDDNRAAVSKDMMSQIGESLEELEPTVSEEKESSEEMPHAGVQKTLPHTVKMSRPCTPQLNKSTPQSLPLTFPRSSTICDGACWKR